MESSLERSPLKSYSALAVGFLVAGGEAGGGGGGALIEFCEAAESTLL
jgi:hypothetical protein